MLAAGVAAGASVSATTLAKVVVNRSRCMMMVRWMNKPTAVAVAGVFELELELASGIGTRAMLLRYQLAHECARCICKMKRA